MAIFAMKPAAARSIGVTYKMVKLPAEAAPCVPDFLQLVWFTDADGKFSNISEAAYLLPGDEGGAGPVLAVAGILGETCNAPIQWITQWTPEGTGGEPGLFQDGTRLVVWPQPGSGPGLLTVRAFVAGKSYGPIVLTVLRYECAGYGYGGMIFALDPLVWETGSPVIEETNAWDNPGVTHTAAVTGSWPDGTVFVWDYGDAYGFTVTPSGGVLVVAYSAYASGTITASVTATTPSGESLTVGTITITVYPY